MTTDLLGQVCALFAALTWAFALVFFKLSGEHIGPLALNFFKNTIGLVLLGATLLVMGDGVASLRDYHIADIHIRHDLRFHLVAEQRVQLIGDHRVDHTNLIVIEVVPITAHLRAAGFE